jgi:hypothetical protein
VGNAQLLRKLEAIERSLQNNTKIVLPNDSDIINIIGEMAGGVLPVNREQKQVKEKNNAGRNQASDLRYDEGLNEI